MCPKKLSRSHEPRRVIVPHVKHDAGYHTHAEVPQRLVRSDLNRYTILWLQNTIGNAAVQRMLTNHDEVIQRDVARNQEIARRYQDFIQNAEKYGLPVKFLKVVAQSVNFQATTGSNEFAPGGTFRAPRLSLREDTMQVVENMSPLAPAGEASGIQSIYHEAVHAYLLTQGPKNKDIDAFNKAGEQHYKNAPLQGGKVADDAKRVFQEAAAEYVGWRVATWWQAFERLSAAASSNGSPDAIAKAIEQARQHYNNDMGRRTFGYQMTGVWPFNQQTETTRAMSEEVKKFLDQNVLEGKIPDTFDNNAGFQQLIAQAQTLANQRSQQPTP